MIKSEPDPYLTITIMIYGDLIDITFPNSNRLALYRQYCHAELILYEHLGVVFDMERKTRR